MRGSFEDVLSFLASLSPSRITFNLNVSSIYADGVSTEGLTAKGLWDALSLEEGERVECCGEAYDGKRIRGSFYTGVALHLRSQLSWHRGTLEAFAVLYDRGDVVIVEGNRRRAYRGSFRERGNLHLYGWRYANLPGGGMFYTEVPRGTRRFALISGSFRRLTFPSGFNVLVRIYEEVGDWREAVLETLKKGGTEVRSPQCRVFRIGRYVVKVLGEDILIVHERRATFRVLYERFLRGGARRRRLLMPVSLGELDQHRSAALRRLGFRFEGGKLVEVPDFLGVVDPAALSSLVEEVSGTEGDEGLAIKAARVLSGYPAMDPEELIMNLMLCNNPYQDPEGRVIVRRITVDDLDDLLQ